MPRLALENLTKEFAPARGIRVPALRGLSLTLEPGELMTLVGLSGCGKTTTLRLIAGLETPTSGQIMLDGRRLDTLPPAQRPVAMVFQDHALYPHLTARENLTFGLKWSGLGPVEIQQRLAQTTEMLGLTGLLDRLPGQLSGGESQRLALGRALIRHPQILLCDEPLSQLDAALRFNLRRELAALHRRLGLTTLYVTHDQSEAMALGDRLCVMRAGTVEQTGSPMHVYDRPKSRFVAEFFGFGTMNLWPVRIEGGDAVLPWGARLPAPDPAAFPRQRGLLLGLRPEEVRLDGSDNLAEVDRVEWLGPETIVRLTLGGASVICRASHRPALSIGQKTGVTFNWPKAVWLGADPFP